MKYNFKKHSLNYSYYLLMFFLPLSVFLDNVALFFLLLFGVLQKRIDFKYYQIIIGSLICYFLYDFLSSFINGVFLRESAVYLRLLPLLLIPIAMTSLTDVTKQKGLIYLLFGIVVMQLIAIYGIVDYYYFTEGRKIVLRSYAGINDILRFERPYLGYFSCLSVIISYCFFKKERPWIFFIITLLSSFLIITMAARLALLILIASIIIVIIYELRNKVLKWITLFGLPIFAIIILSISNSPLKHRFLQIKFDTRIIVWEGAWDIFKNSPSYFFGYASQEKIERDLVNYYEAREFEYLPEKQRFLTKKYNTHNQYLNQLLKGGVIGLIIFLVPFTYLLIKNWRKSNMIHLLLLLSLLLFFSVENLLERQIGVYSVAIILSITNEIKSKQS